MSETHPPSLNSLSHLKHMSKNNMQNLKRDQANSKLNQEVKVLQHEVEETKKEEKRTKENPVMTFSLKLKN